MQSHLARLAPHALAHCISVATLAVLLAGCQGTERPLAPVPDAAQLNRSEDSRVRGKITFHSGRAGNTHVFIMNADGSDQTQLTRTADFEFDPVLSPNGRKIAYISFPATCCANARISVLNADGTGATQLTDNGFLPVWSPDSRQLAFTRDAGDGFSDVYVMNADGSNVRRLTTRAFVDRVTAWSPNGRQIAFISYRDYVTKGDSGDTDFFVMNADGSGIRALTDNNVDDFGDHAGWSPDGRLFVFSRSAPGTNSQTTSEIFVMNANGTNARQLTGIHGDVAYDNNPVWSPDGKRIAFNSTRDGNEEVYTMNLQGTDLRRLTRTTGSFSAVPSWVPGRVRSDDDERE